MLPRGPADVNGVNVPSLTEPTPAVQVVRDPEARYWGGPVEELSLVPLGEARLGRIGLDEWLRRSQAKA